MRLAGLLIQIALIGGIGVAGMIYVGYSAMARLTAPPAEVASSTAIFAVEPGDSTAVIGQKLQEEGLIRNDLVFRLLVGRRGMDGKLQAGQFLLRETMTLNEIIDELAQGRVLNDVITVVEGWRAEQIAEALGAMGLIDPADFLAVVRNGLVDFDYDFLPPPGEGRTLEGFLFPDTYEIGPQTTARELVAAMLSRFDQVYTQPMRDAASRRNLTAHQVANLAAIVEREAALDVERPRIAAVFLNRLTQGMRLEADPTVQYAVASPEANGTWWKAELTAADLQIDSPYNTYLVPGLPAGPIANPGIRAILAVVEPEETEELFFVSRGDGSHAFAATIEEHERNVNRFRR